MTIHFPDARMTGMRIPGTKLTIYDLEPRAASLVAVASDSLLDPRIIDPDNLPAGCRWVSDEEWGAAHERRADVIAAAEMLGC